MVDDQLEEKMLNALREAGISEDVYWRGVARGVHLRNKNRKRKPVSGFPLSLVELLLHSVLNVTERTVERFVRRIERRLRKWRR